MQKAYMSAYKAVVNALVTLCIEDERIQGCCKCSCHIMYWRWAHTRLL